MMWSTSTANSGQHCGARSTQELFPGLEQITWTLVLTGLGGKTVYPFRHLLSQTKHNTTNIKLPRAMLIQQANRTLGFKRPITCGAKCLNDLAELRRCLHATATLHNEQTQGSKSLIYIFMAMARSEMPHRSSS